MPRRPSAPSPARPPQICVVGGGFAGLFALLALSRQRWPRRQRPRLLLVDCEAEFAFLPLLYERLTGEVERWEVAPSFSRLLAGTGAEFCQGTVETVAFDRRQVCLTDGRSLAYDLLVLAAGQTTRLAALSGATERALPFRTLADADRLLDRLGQLEGKLLDQPWTAAIVGDGPSGVELAGKLADRWGDRGVVRLVVPGETLLPGFPDFARETAREVLAGLGVKIHWRSRAVAVTDEGAVLARGEHLLPLAADAIVWAAGAQPCPWTAALDCPRDRKGYLRVRPTLQLAGHPEVFALGDGAAIFQPDGSPVPRTAQAALQEARCAARNARSLLLGRRLHPFRYRHQGDMVALGRRSAAIVAPGVKLRGRPAAWLRQFVYLMSRMPTVRHRCRIAGHRLRRLLRLGRRTQ